MDKIPCVHAIAAAETAHISRITLAHPHFRRESVRNAYAKVVMPRDVSQLVPKVVAIKVCKPPFVRQPPGRPKNSRIKSVLEVVMDKKRPRKDYTCSKCHQTGHNRTTCES